MNVAWLWLALLSALLAPSLAAVSYHGYKVFRLVPTEEQLPLVWELRQHPGLDFWSRRHSTGQPVDVMVPPQLQAEFRALLDRHGVLHSVHIHDVQQDLKQKEVMRLKSSLPKKAGARISFTEYHQYDEIRQYLSDLAASYPSMVSVQSIGQSYEGRPLDVIQISSGGDGSRPVILIDAGIHAREWVAPAAALYVIHQLVENATESALTDSVDWHIVPVLNPDGYEYTFSGDRYWRKTRSQSSGRCIGVDGNRNFDYHWMESGSSSAPCSEIYAGPEAFSESETQALRDYILANRERIKIYLTFHTYGPYILYPWSYADILPDDWELLDALGQQANLAQLAAGGELYEVGSSTALMGATAGSSDDWTKGVGGVNFSYTIELPGRGYGFAPPPSEIIPIVVPFFEAVRVFGNYVAENFS